MSTDRPPAADLDPEPVLFIVYKDGRPALKVDFLSVDLRQEVIDIRESHRKFLAACCPNGLIFSD
jgi:hypothetical protein